MRIAHCKFLDGIPIHETDKEEKMNHSGYYDKIVTCAWTLDRKNSVLTYGATIFRKADNRDHWVKADHRDKAIERYNTCPVVVKLINFDRYDKENAITDRAIDWYIARNLVLSLGAYTKNGRENRMTEAVLGIEDGQILITSLITLPRDFNHKYDPNLRFHLPEGDDLSDKDTFEEDLFWALLGCSVVGILTYLSFRLI